MTLRVLHCIYDDLSNPWVAGGGAVRTHELYRRLGAVVEAEVVTGRYPGARDGVVDGVRYRRVGRARPYPWSRWTYSRAAESLLRRGDYDVGIYDFSVYAPVRVPRDRPVGVVVHHLTGPTASRRWGRLPGGLVRAVERALLGRGRVFGVSSGWTAHALRALLGPGPEIQVVGNGVADALFRLERAESDYVLFLGRLDYFQKGLDVLLDAFARVPDRGVVLRIAGRGRDGDRVRRRIVELGLEERAVYHGPVTDEERLELLRGARLLAMPSRFEGFGLVAAEAMAAGVPVVASDAGALPEVVAPPQGGVVVPSEDPAALASAITALLDDPARRAALRASARASARRFSWDAVADRHRDFLEHVAAGMNPEPAQP